MPQLTLTRRHIAVGLSALGLMALALAVTPWRIGPGPMRDEAERRIRMALDAPQATLGRLSLALLPSPHLHVDSISFTRSDGSFSGMAPSASIAVKFDSLLRGVAKPAALTLHQPTLSLRLDGGGTVFDRTSAARAALVAMLAGRASFNGLNEIAVENGRLHLADRTGATVIEGLVLNATIASAERPLRLSGSGRVDGQDVRLTFTGASPAALRSGVDEPITLNIATPAATLDFRGSGSLARDIAAKGQLSVNITDGQRLPFAGTLASLGLDVPAIMQLRAGLTIAARSATFSDLSMLTGSNRFDGVGALRHDGQRWQASATLATAEVNLTPVAALTARARQADGGWNRSRFDPAALFSVNLDLRISAEKATVGTHILTRAAMAVMARPDRLEVSLNDGGLYAGRARGRLVATRSASGFDYRLTANLASFDAGKAADAAGLPQRFTGTGNAEMVLDASGASAAEIAASLDGKLVLGLRGGDIAGIDLNRLANRRSAKPQLLLTDALGGKTPFESAALSARIRHGQAKPVEGSLQANRLSGTISGEIDLSGDDIRLFGNVVQLQSEPGPADPLPVIEFSVSGPITAPRVTPNVANLLKRS